MLWAANREFGDEGDDAFFVLPSKDAAGVADGTGYWRNKGITSGPYTRSMMINTRNYMEDGFNPYDALEAASINYEKVKIKITPDSVRVQNLNR